MHPQPLKHFHMIVIHIGILIYPKESAEYRGVYSSKKSELFPSAKRHLSNPSPISQLQMPPNQGHRSIFFFDIFCDNLGGGITVQNALGTQGGGHLKLENFVFLKLESCNLMKTLYFWPQI